jgi:acyl carrier protein
VGEAVPPLELRRHLLQIVAEVLETDVDATKRFLALGGDSIRAMQVSGRARRRFGADLSPRDLLSSNSIEEAVASASISASVSAETEIDPGGGREGVETSRGQQQLWTVHAISGGTAAYNVASALHFRGRVRTDALATSIRETLRAHEALRTVFREGKAGLERVVLPPDGVEVEHLDVREQTSGERDDVYSNLVARLAAEPFSLSAGPVLRAALIARRDDLCTFLLVIHHTAVDAWSLGLLYEEIQERYAGALEGADAPPPADIPYGSYVRAEARARAERREQDLRWWAEYLVGTPTVLALGGDAEAPSGQPFAGARLQFEFDAGNLRETSMQIVVTPFILMLAAFGLCIGAATDKRDFLLGVPIAGRPDAALHDLVGFCAKLLPVRIALGAPDESFSRFAQRLQTAFSLVLDHTTIDIADLVQQQKLSASHPRNPLVQVVFAKHDDVLRRGYPLEGVELEYEDLGTGASPVDLTMFVESSGGSARGSVEYATAAIAETEAAGIAADFARVLGRVLSDPGCPLGEIGVGPRSALAAAARLPTSR